MLQIINVLFLIKKVNKKKIKDERKKQYCGFFPRFLLFL